jgi:hypothetical protein
MSTILKALRRLEEDNPTNTENQSDELRDRILAEESAVQAAHVEHQESNRTKRFAIAGAAALLAVGLAVGAYTLSTRSGSEEIAELVAVTPPTPPSAAAAPQVEDPRAEDPRIEETRVAGAVIAPANDRAAVSPPPTPTPVATPAAAAPTLSTATAKPTASQRPPAVLAASEANEARPAKAQPAAKSVPPPAPTPPVATDKMALAAVTPTSATLAASSGRAVSAPEKALAEPPPKRPAQAQRRRPSSTAADPGPPSVSAPKPAPRTTPASATSPTSTASTPPVQKAKPARSEPSPEIQQVDRRDSPELTPDLTIVRTSWHPKADRRSAKIRLEETEEVLTLREGDAVGGLVIQEISPSAVVFKAGDVEIHRRVGQPGSGG